VTFDDGLGPVVHDRAGHTTEVGERPPVAVPERGQIHAGRVRHERVPRVRQDHVEGIDVPDTDVPEQIAFLAPVDLGLGAWDDLEAAVQPDQRVLIPDRQLIGQAGAFLGQVLLDPLVGAGEPVLGDQPFVNHRPLDRDVSA